MTAPEPAGRRDAGRVLSMFLLGAALIGLGNILRHMDDALADLGD